MKIGEIMDFEQIKNEVEKQISEKRFIHSCGVAKRAQELAKIYGEDEDKAKIIGIAHDIAKEMPKEEALKYANENGIIFDEIEQKEPSLWHSKIGADIAVKRLRSSTHYCTATWKTDLWYITYR